MAIVDREIVADRFGYAATEENLVSVLRQLDQGRVDLAYSVVQSMIGRLRAEKPVDISEC
jgi:hypothetical protein